MKSQQADIANIKLIWNKMLRLVINDVNTKIACD